MFSIKTQLQQLIVLYVPIKRIPKEISLSKQGDFFYPYVETESQLYQNSSINFFERGGL